MKRPAFTSLIAPLTGAMMTVSAAAQDLPDMPFGVDIYPYEDMNVAIVDLTNPDRPEDIDRGVYHFAYRSCTPDQGRIDLYQWNPQTVKDWVSDEYYTMQREYPGLSQLVIGKDGRLYDMKITENFNRYMSGALESGLPADSPAFKETVREMALGCQPSF